MNSKKVADRLCRKLNTRDPFELAASLNIIVLFEELGSVQGYYNRAYRQKFIHINQELDAKEATFTCAHELAHSLLHSRMNTPFLRKNTFFSVDKLETEANRMALEIIYSDDELQPFLERSISDAAAYMGVPIPLAEYRMSHVCPKGLSKEGL